MNYDLLRLEDLAYENYAELSVHQFRVVGYYIKHGCQWSESLHEVAAECKMSVSKCAEVIRELMRMRWVSPYPDFRANRAGWLYVISDGVGHYKVGIADLVMQRLAELQTGNPYPLTVALQILSADCASFERRVRSEFKDKHIRGEWYRLSADDLDRIKGLAE